MPRALTGFFLQDIVVETDSMSSHMQKRASRANGRQSRGPATPEGRQQSAQARITHGLTAKARVLPGEDPEQAAQLAQSIFDDVQPIGALENELCDAVISACTLRRRCDRKLTGTLTEQIENALDQIDRLVEADLARCRALYQGKNKKSIEAIEGLRQSAPGCAFLIGRLEYLKDV